MTHKVLMVSWLFAPHVSIGAKRAYRFARWLPSQGWHPTVLCRRRAPASATDPSPWPLPPQVSVHAEYDSPLVAPLTRTSHEGIAAVPMMPEAIERTWRARLSEKIGLFVDAIVPTETVVVHAPHAMRVIERLTPSHDVIWTTSYPYHAHLLGLRAARRHTRPIVVDLRDPWTPNWVHRRKFAVTRALEAWMERYVFAHADRVVVTTWALEALYREMFPAHAEKFVTIHNSFDPPEDGFVDVRAAGDPVRLVHFGNVYGPWSLATVYRALSLMLRRGEIDQRSVVIENYGKLSDHDRALATSLGVAPMLRLLPPLPFTKGMARMRGADGLLLAAWDHPDARLYVQGKLFDYLAAGRPVVAETSHVDVTRIVTETHAGVVVAPGDLDAMCACLRGLIAGSSVAHVVSPDTRARYAAPAAARRLAAVFDELV